MYVFIKTTNKKDVESLYSSGIDSERGSVFLVWHNTGNYTVFAHGPTDFCGAVVEHLGGAENMVAHDEGVALMPSAKMMYPKGVPLTVVRSDIDGKVRKARQELIASVRPDSVKQVVTLDSIMGG